MISLPTKYPLETVFNNMDKETIEIDNIKIKMGSMRYQLFKNKGVVCVCCGKIGSHFKITKNFNESKTGHFNLFTDDGVLMTKDHIVPRSLKGSNELENFQTMCSKCNNNKKNVIKVEDLFAGQIKKGVWLSKKCLTKTNISNIPKKSTFFKKLSLNQIKKLKKQAGKNHKEFIQDYITKARKNVYIYQEDLPTEINDIM